MLIMNKNFHLRIALCKLGLKKKKACSLLVRLNLTLGTVSVV